MKENEMKFVDNTIDDSKEIVTIDYYDRIHKKWIKVDVTKEVARFLYRSDRQMKRENNRYYYKNLPFDEVFDGCDEEKEKYLVDINSTFDLEEDYENEYLREIVKEHQITIIQNALSCLSEKQRDVIEKIIYEKKSYREISNELGIDKSSVFERVKRAKKNIKKYIANTQN